MMHPLKVSLEDLYNGKTTKLQLSKNVLCSACSGQGGKSGAVQKCSACRGRGVRIMIRQLAPGMVQQMQSVCSDCNGEGMHASVALPFCWNGLGMQKLERLTVFLFQRVFIGIIL